jgi:hypothetical protein
MDDGQLIQVTFVGTAILLLAIAVFLIIRTRMFLKRAVETTGTVVAYVTSHSSEGGPTYKPVIEFRANGRLARFTDTMGSSPPAYDIGEVIPVKYDPQRPNKARPNKPFRLWFAPGLLILLALVFGGVGYFVGATV